MRCGKLHRISRTATCTKRRIGLDLSPSFTSDRLCYLITFRRISRIVILLLIARDDVFLNIDFGQIQCDTTTRRLAYAIWTAVTADADNLLILEYRRVQVERKHVVRKIWIDGIVVRQWIAIVAWRKIELPIGLQLTSPLNGIDGAI